MFHISLILTNLLLLYSLVLTRHLDTQNERLVDSKTHKTLRTRAEGNRVFVEMNSEYLKRHLALSTEHTDDKDNFQDHIRKLNKDVPMASFGEAVDAAIACKYFLGFEVGSASAYCVRWANNMGTYETGALVSRANIVFNHVLPNGESCDRLSAEEQVCDTYDHVAVQGTRQLYKVQCCGKRGCTLHVSTNGMSDCEHRRLGKDLGQGQEVRD